MVRYGTEPADAYALAASLRALALAVQAMAAEIGRLAFLHPGEEIGSHDGGPVLDAMIRTLGAFSPPELRDTS